MNTTTDTTTDTTECRCLLDGEVCHPSTLVPRAAWVNGRVVDVVMICPGDYTHGYVEDDGEFIPAEAPRFGPVDDPGRRALTVPRGYVPPTTDVAGLTWAAVARNDAEGAPGTDARGVRGIARLIVELGGFDVTDVAFLLGVARFIDETWERDFWTAHAWIIAARVVRGQE